MLREEEIFIFVEWLLKMFCLSYKNQIKPNQAKIKTQTHQALSGVVEGKLGKKTLMWNTESGAGVQEEEEKSALLWGINSMMLPAQEDISNVVLEKGKTTVVCVYWTEDGIAHCLLLITQHV